MPGRLAAMATTYYKRYRMEIDLDGSMPPPVLPEPFRWVSWDEALIADHASVKFACFRGELDSSVFPSLGDAKGCLRLMREIRRKPGFLPTATWLILGPESPVATIQGIIERGSVGSIQNVGVVPEARGLGLGRLLVRQALEGFYQVGLRKASLEVTAINLGAVRLYDSMGFRRAKTLFKAVSA